MPVLACVLETTKAIQKQTNPMSRVTMAGK
jgi:hypothetical protein